MVICCAATTASVVNSTITGNAGYGIDATADGPVTLDHVTVSGNDGAVVWSPWIPPATFTVHASILDGTCSGDLVSAGENVSATASCLPVPRPGDLVTDPQIGPLADNGGPTQTHMPAAESQAIDRVDPAGCPPTDQRLAPRPVGAACDAGAVEVGVAASADLALTLQDTDPVAAGGTITYTATVTNNGPDGASGVTLTLRLPLEATFVSADPGCTNNAGEVTCVVGNLGPPASAVRTIVAAAPADGGLITAAAHVAAASPADPDPNNNSTTEPTTVVAVPAVSLADSSVVEGTSATPTPASVTATLSTPAAEAVSVQWTTVDGTATSPADLTAASGTLMFAPGETSRTIDLSVVADGVVEPDESFNVQLSAPHGMTIADGAAVVTIDDDDLPALAVSDVSVIEPDAGTTNATFEITLDEAPVAPVTATVATVEGTATAGSDFVATTATVTFAAGDQTELFVVPIVGDLVPEPTEELFVTVSGVSGATVADGDGRGTITDTDVPGFTIDDASVTEADNGLTVLTFTVRRGAGTGVAWVTATTFDGTAAQPADYRSRTTPLRFGNGVTERPFTVIIVGDLLAEPDETFLVRLSSPLGAPILDGEATGTIVDDGDICTQVGTTGDDVLVGGPGSDVLCGIGGDDELYGEDGDDQLLGGAGRDALYGGPGADELTGGLGADQLDGGDGADVGHGDDGGDPETTTGSFDSVSGGPGNDTLHGQAGSDTIDGGPGMDRIHGGEGNDTVNGGAESANVLVGGSGDVDRCAVGPPPGNVRDMSCERPQAGTVVVDPWWG